MGSVAVVTDTCHYLPRQLVAARGIHEVSLYVHWDSREDREADLPRLRRLLRAPAHGEAAADDLAAVDRRLPRRLRAAAGGGPRRSSRSTSSGAISGTFASAEQAREQLAGRGRDRIHVIDSQSACGGQGLVVLAAHAAAARGANAQEVVAHAREARAALQMWFAVDTLEYLRRGGRIGAAQA